MARGSCCASQTRAGRRSPSNSISRSSRGEALRNVRLAENVVLEPRDKKHGSPWLLVQADIGSATEPARYFLPLALAWEDRDGERIKQLAPAAVARIRQQASVGLLAD